MRGRCWPARQVLAAVFAAGVGAWAWPQPIARPAVAPEQAFAQPASDPEALLRLDPERISADEVRDVLAAGPAPTILALQGSLPSLTMRPLSEFLIAMGYPEARLRDPASGGLSYPSSGDSAALAGMVAWRYEHEGMMPMLVGHSQGGMQVIRVLHELAGRFRPSLAVHSPYAEQNEGRTEVVDPLSGERRPVVGLRVGYAVAIATGKLPRILLGQWNMIPLLRKIPDSVEEFLGLTIDWDPIAGTFPGSEPYRATGTARVRNVALAARVSHVGAIELAPLAADPIARAWIESYTPGHERPLPAGAAVNVVNIVQAAELWHGIKKHWCIEAQRVLRARRLPAPR